MDDFELFARQFRHLVSALSERYGWTPEEAEQRYHQGVAAIWDWYTDPRNAEEVCRLIQELRTTCEMTDKVLIFAGENPDDVCSSLAACRGLL